MEADPRAMLAEGARRLSHREIKVARRAFEMAAQSAQATGDVAVRVEALALVARCYFLGDQRGDGLVWLEQAEGLADPEEPLGWSRTQKVRGLFERSEGNGERALEIFERLFGYCKERELYERALDAAHHLALLAPLDGQVLWARRAIAAAEQSGNEALLAILWNNLGLTYERMLRPQESLACFRRARWFHYRTGEERDKLIADWAVGRALRLAERSPEAMLWLKDVVLRAEERWRQSPGEDRAAWRAYALMEYGEVLADLALVEEAIESMESARKVLLGLGGSGPADLDFEELLVRIEELRSGYFQ